MEPAPTTATMTSLDRKQQVQSVLQARKEERPLPPPKPSTATSKPRPQWPKPETAAKPPEPAPPTPGSAMSTTERLLRLKKQREDDKDPERDA